MLDNPQTVHSDGDLPEGSLPIGTYVRSLETDCLGIVTDSFVGAEDEVGTEILIYSILLLPKRKTVLDITESTLTPFYMINELEYNIIAYNMIKPMSKKGMDLMTRDLMI
jgi:hypothetical protein